MIDELIAYLDGALNVTKEVYLADHHRRMMVAYLFIFYFRSTHLDVVAARKRYPREFAIISNTAVHNMRALSANNDTQWEFFNDALLLLKQARTKIKLSAEKVAGTQYGAIPWCVDVTEEERLQEIANTLKTMLACTQQDTVENDIDKMAALTYGALALGEWQLRDGDNEDEQRRVDAVAVFKQCHPNLGEFLNYFKNRRNHWAHPNSKDFKEFVRAQCQDIGRVLDRKLIATLIQEITNYCVLEEPEVTAEPRTETADKVLSDKFQYRYLERIKFYLNFLAEKERVNKSLSITSSPDLILGSLRITPPLPAMSELHNLLKTYVKSKKQKPFSVPYDLLRRANEELAMLSSIQDTLEFNRLCVEAFLQRDNPGLHATKINLAIACLRDPRKRLFKKEHEYLRASPMLVGIWFGNKLVIDVLLERQHEFDYVVTIGNDKMSLLSIAVSKILNSYTDTNASAENIIYLLQRFPTMSAIYNERSSLFVWAKTFYGTTYFYEQVMQYTKLDVNAPIMDALGYVHRPYTLVALEKGAAAVAFFKNPKFIVNAIPGEKAPPLAYLCCNRRTETTTTMYVEVAGLDTQKSVASPALLETFLDLRGDEVQVSGFDKQITNPLGFICMADKSKVVSNADQELYQGSVMKLKILLTHRSTRDRIDLLVSFKIPMNIANSEKSVSVFATPSTLCALHYNDDMLALIFDKAKAKGLEFFAELLAKHMVDLNNDKYTLQLRAIFLATQPVTNACYPNCKQKTIDLMECADLLLERWQHLDRQWNLRKQLTKARELAAATTHDLLKVKCQEKVTELTRLLDDPALPLEHYEQELQKIKLTSIVDQAKSTPKLTHA